MMHEVLDLLVWDGFRVMDGGHQNLIINTCFAIMWVEVFVASHGSVVRS